MLLSGGSPPTEIVANFHHLVSISFPRGVRDAAQYICTDLNVNPQDSDIAKCAIANGMMYDIPMGWFGENGPPPTYNLDGVTPEMKGKATIKDDS